ncbi:hypothetical protein [Shewanella maritima]|uniref:hypothetical protein n=1 Tax=Shewanella maritima TaxID=2520507 RepID=UPI0037354410
MTALTKEEVISALSAALEKQSGKAVQIEQSGSWYKIDGGKSVRFSELEKMLAELSGDDTQAVKAAPKAEVKTKAPAKPKAAKKPVAKAKPKATGKSGGLTPKEMWRAKLEKAAGKNTLPRGF